MIFPSLLLDEDDVIPSSDELIFIVYQGLDFSSVTAYKL
jgi:hypothetical protein